MATPSNPVETIKTQKSGFDLLTFSDVQMFKIVTPPAKVDSVNAALAHLGNDHAKLLEIINSGLREAEVEKARSSAEGWATIDEEGKETPYSGILVEKEEDIKTINNTVLGLAKMAFGYDAADLITDVEKKRAAKRSAKEAAVDHIRTSPVLLDGLKAKILVK